MVNACVWEVDGQSFSLGCFVGVAMNFTAILVDLLSRHSAKINGTIIAF